MYTTFLTVLSSGRHGPKHSQGFAVLKPADSSFCAAAGIYSPTTTTHSHKHANTRFSGWQRGSTERPSMPGIQSPWNLICMPSWLFHIHTHNSRPCKLFHQGSQAGRFSFGFSQWEAAPGDWREGKGGGLVFSYPFPVLDHVSSGNWGHCPHSNSAQIKTLSFPLIKKKKILTLV